MRFDQFIPTAQLRPYIKYYVISENEQEAQYKVFPVSGLVAGFQYKGRLAVMEKDRAVDLAASGITGISDSYRIFKNTPGIGTLLVYFTETGLAQFSSLPANEIFNQSISLNEIFDKTKTEDIEERLSLAVTDRQRIRLMDTFLLSELKNTAHDLLVTEAVKLIYQSGGAIQIKELRSRLFISQSPLEKRFRKLVGTTPKQFSAIVRFNTVLGSLRQARSLTEICYENGFFDQAHFIKDFRRFTGDSPEHFRQLL